MDETKKFNLDEVLDNKPMYDNLGQNLGTPTEYAMHLRSVKGNLVDLDKAQEAPECIALSMNEDKDTIKQVVSEQGSLRGHPLFESKKKTSIKVFNVQPEEEVYVEMMKLSGLIGKTDHISTVLNRCIPGKREDAYPELPKGKLLYAKHAECECCESIKKDYITLQMKESKDEIKKILEQQGDVGHPNLTPPFDLHDLDAGKLQEVISGAFPDEQNMRQFCVRLGKRLKGDRVEFSYKTKKLMINGVMTKFDTRDIVGAIQSLARVIPAKEAERLVAREIAKKIQNVL